MSDGLKILKKLAEHELQKKYPSAPKHALPGVKYSDKTANGLTKCIIDWIRFNDGQAERISVVSRKVAGKFVKSAMTKGTADISATIPETWYDYDENDYLQVFKIGRSVKIEVKIGKDRQSEEQKQYERDIVNAGGLYFIAKDFNSFYEWYNDKF